MIFTEREMIQFSDKILIQTFKDTVVACYLMWLFLPQCFLRLAATTVTLAIVLVSCICLPFVFVTSDELVCRNFACFI